MNSTIAKKNFDISYTLCSLRRLLKIVIGTVLFCGAINVPQDIAQENFGDTEKIKEAYIFSSYLSTSNSYGYNVISSRDKDDIHRSFKMHHFIYPRDVYYGDTIYIACLYENISEQSGIFLDSFDCNNWDMLLNDVSILLKYKEHSIHYYPEKQYQHDLGMRSGDLIFFKPGDIRLSSVFFIETPPLEDMSEPFWQAIRSDVWKGENVVLNVEIYLSPSVIHISDSLKESFTIKRRPDEEMHVLAEWFNKTPLNMKPSVQTETNGYMGRDTSYKYSPEIPNEHTFDIIVDLPIRNKKNSYFCCDHNRESSQPPQLSIPVSQITRPGNRKPGIPNVPNTLDGWRQLETYFTDSTIRDEIHLTTLLIDYCIDAACDYRNTEKVDAIIDWLENRPYAERLALSFYLGTQHPELQSRLSVVDFYEGKNGTAITRFPSDSIGNISPNAIDK